MPTVTKTLGEGTQSVLLTVAILECLALEKHPVSVSDLAKRIGTSKSRVFRHLRTLLACDYVIQDEIGGSYGIGPRLLALCQSTGDRHDLGRIAAPFMEKLCERFRHSVIVSRIEADGVHVLKSVSGHTSIVLEVRQGTVLSFDRSAQGKIALAFVAVPNSDRPGPSAAARRSFVKAHRGELETIQRTGIATAQMREGLMGIATPIFDGNGVAIGTLALLNTVAEIQGDNEVVAALKVAALAVSQELGYRPGVNSIRAIPV
jgi:IclR family KDG regulon transcriptional repressor